MVVSNRRERFLLITSDFCLLVLSLYLSLLFRNLSFPNTAIFSEHLYVFLPLFIISIVNFFIGGLYEKRRLVTRRNIPEILVRAQLANLLIGFVLFYLFSFSSITPKTILMIFVLFGTISIFISRTIIISSSQSKKSENAILIASGKEAEELMKEINNDSRYGLKFSYHINTDVVDSLDFEKDIMERIYDDQISMVVIDSNDQKIAPLLPKLYNLLLSSVRFESVHEMYEQVFDKVPISLLKYNWFLDNISLERNVGFDVFKRFMDIVIALILFIISLPIYLFVFVIIKIQDGGSLFSFQDRVGRHGRTIKLIKFRTMLFDDNGEWAGRKNEVTRFGKFLRKTRIDELPQLINVLRGEVSLIGPRPEFPKAVHSYVDAIPYYNSRHIIMPGLSGWAQIYHQNHPHHGVDIEETRNKLAHDLYYIKHRSPSLDIVIALKTIKTLLSRQGK